MKTAKEMQDEFLKNNKVTKCKDDLRAKISEDYRYTNDKSYAKNKLLNSIDYIYDKVIIIIVRDNTFIRLLYTSRNKTKQKRGETYNMLDINQHTVNRQADRSLIKTNLDRGIWKVATKEDKANFKKTGANHSKLI